MNRAEIISLALEVGFNPMSSQEMDMFERFAALVAAHALIEPCCGNYDQCQKVCMPRAAAAEREACAKVCEENATDLSEGDWDSACINCADHIRARGQK